MISGSRLFFSDPRLMRFLQARFLRCILSGWFLLQVTRIVNLALKMLNRDDFDAEKFIEKLKPGVFAIDLHWLVHVQGSLEVAKICKKFHPDVPVVLGGLSATYFSEEILKKFPEVDYVIKGDSTEPLMLELIERQGKVKSNHLCP